MRKRVLAGDPPPPTASTFRFQRFEGVGFGIWGLGFEGLGFGVWGLGFEVWGLGFGVRGSRFGVWSFWLEV